MKTKTNQVTSYELRVTSDPFASSGQAQWRTAYCLLRTAFCILLAAFCLLPAGGALAQATNADKQIAYSDLVGKWTLTKIEVVKMQGEAELGRQTFTATNYSGKIYFEKLECFSDGKANYSGKADAGLLVGGSVQLYGYDLPGYLTFHGKTMGVSFGFQWLVKPASFLLISETTLDQQSGEKEKILLHYVKE